MAKETDGKHVPRRLKNFEVMRRQVFLGSPEPEPVYYRNRHLYKLNRADIKDQEKVAKFLEDEDAVTWDYSRGEWRYLVEYLGDILDPKDSILPEFRNVPDWIRSLSEKAYRKRVFRVLELWLDEDSDEINDKARPHPDRDAYEYFTALEATDPKLAGELKLKCRVDESRPEGFAYVVRLGVSMDEANRICEEHEAEFHFSRYNRRYSRSFMERKERLGYSRLRWADLY